MIKTISVIVVGVLLVSFAFGVELYDGMDMVLNTYGSYPIPAIDLGIQSDTILTVGCDLYALYSQVYEVSNSISPTTNDWILLDNIGINQGNFSMLLDCGLTTYNSFGYDSLYVFGLTTRYQCQGSIFDPAIAFSMLWPFTTQNVYYPMMIISFENSIDLGGK